MLVFRWPPQLAVVGAEWTVEDPVSRSRSLLSGKTYMSASQRRRRIAALNTEGAYGDGGGYIEDLKELLRGGIHAVRLHSFPVNITDPLGDIYPLGADELDWTTGGQPLSWTVGGEPLLWFTGAYYSPTPYPLTLNSAFHGVIGRASVSGLPPSTDIARAGMFATVFSENGTTSERRRLLRPVRSSSSGTASIWTTEPFTAPGNVEFNTRDTGIFLPDEMPRAMRPNWAAWQVPWSFREVFADEIAPDTFTEVDPWG